MLIQLIQHFPYDKLLDILDDVISTTEMTRFEDSLIAHRWANFVIQEVLQQCAQPGPKYRIVDVLLNNLTKVVMNVYACSVLDMALTCVGQSTHIHIAEQIVRTPELLGRMAIKASFVTRKCLSDVIQRVFFVLIQANHQMSLLYAKEQIRFVVPKMNKQYGTRILKAVAPEFITGEHWAHGSQTWTSKLPATVEAEVLVGDLIKVWPDTDDEWF